jgi:hypothetical protein
MNRVHLALLGLMILLQAACGRPAPEYCGDVDLVTDEAAPPFLMPDIEESVKSPEEIAEIWRYSPHASSDIQEASNYSQSCNRCHDRLNWDPAQAGSTPVGKSASVVSHPEDGCWICHPESGGSSSKELGWLEDAQLLIYSSVSEPGELCLHCHQGNEVPGHHEIELLGAHADFDCNECHDPHSSTATCTGAGCHPAFTQECENINTHDKPHQEVTCSGCHDAAGYPIGWNEGSAAWDTFRASTQVGGDAMPYTSHEILAEVDCDRCHAPGNHPWGY